MRSSPNNFAAERFLITIDEKTCVNSDFLLEGNKRTKKGKSDELVILESHLVENGEGL